MRPVQRLPGRVFPDIELHRLLARLHGVPQLLVDDAKFRDVDLFPILTRVHARDPTPRGRVLQVAATIPREPADIKGVVQPTGTTSVRHGGEEAEM